METSSGSLPFREDALLVCIINFCNDTKLHQSNPKNSLKLQWNIKGKGHMSLSVPLNRMCIFTIQDCGAKTLDQNKLLSKLLFLGEGENKMAYF